MAAGSHARAFLATCACGTALVVVAVGCTRTDDMATPEPPPGGAQPAPDTDRFADADLTELPLYPGSRPISELTVDETGVVTRSYRVPNAAPGQVMQYFVDTLGKEGWTVALHPQRVADRTWRAQWVQDNRYLLATAFPDPDVAEDTPPQTAQYILALYPEGAQPAPFTTSPTRP